MSVIKAWYVTDRKRYSDYGVVVFAETSGKAKASVLGTDEFPKYDWQFTELCALREPRLDGAYRGVWRMEWDNDNDRLAMVKLCGYYCNEDVFDPDDCERCAGKEYCTRHEEYLEDEREAKCSYAVPFSAVSRR